MPSPEFTNLVDLLAAARVTPDTPLDAARAGYDLVGTTVPLLEGTEVEPLPDDAPVRGAWVRAPAADPDRVVVWFHGGGYVIGSVASHTPLASRLSEASRASVLLVDYRLAPEHPFPAALDDATATQRYLLATGHDPARVAWGGDSAGGGLAVAGTLALREASDPLPAALACSSPWIDLSLRGASMDANAETDIILSRELLAKWATEYLGEVAPTDRRVYPLAAEAHGFPPLLVHVAGKELLADDAARLVEWSQQAGGHATLVVDDDMIHHWHVWAGLFPEATDALDELGAWLGARLG